MSCSATTSFTGNLPGGGVNVVLGRSPDASICPCACAQMTESTCALMIAPRIGVERDLRFVARLDLVQLVLVEQREDLVLVVDEGHDLVEGMPATKKPGRSITFTIVPLPGATTVVCVRSHRAFSSWARVVSTCACDDLHLRLRRGDLRLDLRDGREVAVDPAGELLPHLLLGRARRGDLRGQLVDVGLRLLEIEAVAGAGGGELGVLRDALPAPGRATPAARRPGSSPG